MIPFADLRATVSLPDTVARYVALSERAGEHTGLCPFHDEKTPSFTLFKGRDGVGRFHCYGCGVHGDVIDFVAQIHKETTEQAAARLSAGDLPAAATTPAPIARPRDDTADWLPILPVPEDAPEYGPKFTYNPKRGRNVDYSGAERISTYRALDGRPMFHVARLMIDDKKIPVTITYCRHKSDGRSKWAAVRPKSPFPMLGLPALRERPDAPVIVMEGERKRDLAEPFLPDYVCLSVYGGAVSGLQADLGPLRGRNVIWWPDADQAGVALMTKLASRADTASSSIVSTKDMPAGWDAGDLAESAGASAAMFAEWLAPRLTRPEPPAAVPDDRPAPKTAPRPVEPAPDRPARSAAGGATVTPIRAKKPDPVEDAEPGMPPEYSDDHLADQFAERFSDRFCYVAEAAEWRLWEDGRWRTDRSLITRETIRVKICRAAGMEAMSRTELGAKGQRIAGTLGSARTTGSVDTMARGDRRLAKTLEDFDADLDAINTPAGLVNLRTGEIRPTRPSDYVSRITRASPSGKCPEWLRFLNRTQAGETPDITRENIAFLKRWAGYCMTGDTSEQKFVFFHGPGAAGKGTFINTISWILGDYATSTPMETFTKKTRDGDNGIPADLADLKTARMVTSQETEEGKRWNEQRIKMATGEDAIKARFMRANFFEYQPRFKLLFAGNHRPQLDNVDVAIKRRLILVPFENAVPAGEQDMGLKDRLRAEADGIMQWMLEGCLEWRRYGLKAPEEIMGATAEYFEDQDVPRQFIAECVDMSDRACRVSAGALYGRYVDWCERVGEKPRDMRRFLDSMVENGIRRAPRGRIVEGGQVRAGVAIMVGARLLDPRMRDDSDAFG